MARMETIHPAAFRDLLQAEAVEAMLNERLPHLQASDDLA